MGQLVFEPLGMQQTSILCNNSPEDAAPHASDLEGNSVPLDAAMERFADAVAPAGSVWSTLLDMVKYVLVSCRKASTITASRLSQRKA
jgi:CubicO group peptidase (beta-lactamase class C family)